MPPPARLWLARPSGSTAVQLLVARLNTPMALFSCMVTKARVPSGLTAMYSGSRSSEGSAVL